ncbi:Staphylococcal nuclease (SNase-like) OB-fold [Trinorchestia longiramus]|nr:Staphylococcal nuclease (SNase-like) OB-fold [Trinorchestia longiramus]
MAAPAQNVPDSFKGVVKQVLSGDSVIVRGQPKGGPPPERQINFSNVSAPRLARRGGPSASETQDEPYAWEAREFLRKLVIGKEVVFTIDPKSKTLPREYGCIYLGKDVATGENVTELMVQEGWLAVRRESIRGESTLANKEDQAKSQGKGRWAGGDDKDHVRNIKWTIDNTRAFVDKYNNKPVPAIIEHCPNVRMDGTRPEPNTPEAVGEEAKYFVENLLLQRDIKIVLETANNNNVVGSIIHPSGNIAEALLKKGYAKCVDWSMTTVTGGPEKLRAAEKIAKQQKLKLWVGYKPSGSKVADKDKEFTGRVIEVINGDALVVLKSDNTSKKIFLASIRPPRLDEKDQKTQQSGKTFRPLFDIPWLYEAREFLRTKLIGQKVHVIVDYIQPAQSNYPEKTCCTVKINDINVAEAMVSKGLATVVRYRQDDDQRATCYDDLLAAEAKAMKGSKGLHDKKENTPSHRFMDVNDQTKAKTYLISLKRLGPIEAVPEFVASGSRLRVYIPRQTCLVTLLLAGITCPRASRMAPGGVGGTLDAEPYGNEALNFTRSQVLQREVKIVIESMDKGGNFIGWLFFDDNKNLSVELVEHGLSKMHGTAEASSYYPALVAAEAKARQAKLNIWKNYKPEEHIEYHEEEEEEKAERKIDYRPMIITEITAEGKIYGQNKSDGASLDKLSEALQQAFVTNPPVTGAYNPKRGDLCAAKFIDNMWYRAKVEKVGSGKVHVLYVDYGNRQIITSTRCTQLPHGLEKQPYYAKEMQLALIKFHNEDEYIQDALDLLRSETEDEVMVNTEYRSSGTEFVTMQNKGESDIAKKLLSAGVVLLEKRKDKKLKKLMGEYAEAQEDAKKKHLCIWQYGDITEDDAHEFGMQR